jgi:hypothetical protein
MAKVKAKELVSGWAMVVPLFARKQEQSAGAGESRWQTTE